MEDVAEYTIDYIEPDIPDEAYGKETEYMDFEDKPLGNLSPIDTPDNAPSYVASTLADINKFIFEIQEVNQGFTTGWTQFDNALNKLQPGFHCVGAESNAGKTSFLSQMAWQVYKKNPDAYVLDISLDDALKEKMCRTIAAANKVPINSIKNPNILKKDHPDAYKRVVQGIDNLAKAAWRYRTIDAETWGSDVEEIGQGIKELVIELRSQANPLRLCVFIDNFHDLTSTNPTAGGNDKNKYDHIAQYISDLANELNVPIVCTVELRKLNNFKRPGLDDIRETVKIKYKAKSILLCHNEVGLKGEAASVYYERKDRIEKQPVFEVKFGKNKYSSFKGTLFFHFIPDWAYFVEADRAASKRYIQAIYNSE